MLHIPPTKYLLLATKEEPYQTHKKQKNKQTKNYVNEKGDFHSDI